jgi:hypothetical protein
MPKCYSKCRKVPETLCTHEECRYINGAKYQYCRLSHKYKMDENCIAQPKPELVKERTRKKKNKVDTSNTRKQRIREDAAAKIGKFMRNVDPNKRRALFLKSICSDAGVCISFGKENKKIKEHFHGFIDVKYIKSPIKRIGNPSQNGFVNEITYENNGYVANAILKSSANESSDNLMFEYLVGQYINKKSRAFPCFVETYGWFLYENPDIWTTMKNNKTISNTSILKTLQIQPAHIRSPTSMEIACTNSKYISILIQHIKEAMSLQSMLDNEDFVNNDLLYVLYQIYMPLATLANNFNHYDLHRENVLIYKPIKGKYIDYCYVLNDSTEIKFKSPYIAKMIDYGRCFFKDDESTNPYTNSSMAIYETICKIKKCEPNCGQDVGFGNVSPEDFPGSFYYISSSKRNMSHDLRLLHELKKYNNIKNPVTNKVDYGVGIKTRDEKHYGTIENVDSGLPKKIVNVIDAHAAIKKEILSKRHMKNNQEVYAGMESVGALTIYQDGRDMVFLPK